MNCPLCGKTINNIITKEIRQGKGIVYFCNDCKLGILDNAYPKEFYIEDYRNEYGPMHRGTNPKEEFIVMSKLQEDRVKLVKQYIDKNKRLLDVGCSAGQFISNISPYVKLADGLEINEKFALYASKMTNGLVYNSFDDLPKPGLYDCIVSFQTLEHVDNLFEFMNNIKEILHSEGNVIIEVPNLNDALLSLYDLPEYDKTFYHKAHKWYFSDKSLMNLMDKCGFVGKIKYNQDFGMFNHLYWNILGHGQNNFKLGYHKLDDMKWKKLHISNEIKMLFKDVEERYIDILKNRKMTSNITFIGELK